MKLLIAPQVRSSRPAPSSTRLLPVPRPTVAARPTGGGPPAISPPVPGVLVVEDSSVVRKRVCALIEEAEGVRMVGEAASAFEGWMLFCARRPDAVVLDMHLPDSSGLCLLRRMKAARPDCVVILFTSLADAHSRAECQRYGADAFLHKATEFEQVVPAIERCRAGQGGLPGSRCPEQENERTLPGGRVRLPASSDAPGRGGCRQPEGQEVAGAVAPRLAARAS